MAEADTDTPAAPTQTELVQILAADTPAAIVAERQQDPARRLYPDTSLRGVLGDDCFLGAQAPAADTRKAAVHLRQMLEDTGLSPADAQVLLSRAANGRELARKPEEALRAARVEFQRTFGASAEVAFEGAQRLVAKDPRLAAYLAKTGIAHDPEAMVLLARAARSKRAAGKL